MRKAIETIGAALLILIMACGCSAVPDSTITGPGIVDSRNAETPVDRVLWGYYEISIDPVAQNIDITPLRQAGSHLNALIYMETPTSTLVSIESPPLFGDGKLTIDIGLTHPLPQKLYTGFDVRGILITRGSLEFEGGYIFPAEGNFRLLNPDGYTRYWNPTEFSGDGYQDGILGVPHSIGQFNATVNGFKYFATGLGADDLLETYDPVLRGVFASGQKNIRKYKLEIGDAGLMFNYAVDASWAIPTGNPPSVPDDFDPEKANCKEAWQVVPRLNNLISPAGGECEVEVDVYDWQGLASIEGVYVHAPDIFDGDLELGDPVNNGDYYTFSGSFANDLGYEGVDIPVFIRVRDKGASTNPYLEAFRLEHISIGGDVVITLEEDSIFKTPGTDYSFAHQGFELSTSLPPFDYLDTDGPWDMTGFDSGFDIHKIIYSPDAVEISTFAGDFPELVEVFVRDPGTDGLVYRAEQHDEISGDLILHGMHSIEDFNGTIICNPPAHFQYPQDLSTDYIVTTKVTIIPIILWMEFEYHVTAVGQGWVKTPYDGGTWYNCLYVRTTVDLSSGGTMGQGWEGILLLTEWIADDGTVVAQILTGNDKDEIANFDPVTFEITGTATFLALKNIS